MSRARPYIAIGLDYQGRIHQTALQAWEDAAGTCNTCPGELLPAEELQRDPARRPPAVPWRALCAGAVVLIATPLVLRIVLTVLPAVQMVAAR